jgi:hypothetical protein
MSSAAERDVETWWRRFAEPMKEAGLEVPSTTEGLMREAFECGQNAERMAIVKTLEAFRDLVDCYSEPGDALSALRADIVCRSFDPGESV